MRAVVRFALVLAVLAFAMGNGSGPAGHAAGPGDQALLRRAEQIRKVVDRRYRSAAGRKLGVPDASPTSVVASLTLLDDVVREVPAAHGIYFDLCTPGASCPFPAASAAWDVRALRPRRAAFELAVRLFSATAADLVVVSLPTPTPVLVVLERGEIHGGLRRAFHEAVFGDPATARADVRRIVDANTLAHLYVPAGLEAITDRDDTLVATPLAVPPPPADAHCDGGDIRT